MKRTPLARVSAKRSRPGPSARVNPNKVCEDCGGPISQKAAGLCRRCSSTRNAVKATATPGRVIRLADVKRRCANCGKTFTVRPYEGLRGARFCSQRCMGEAWRKPKICVVCGSEFWRPRDPYRKTCSRKCLSALKSRNQLGRYNPNYVTGIDVGRGEWQAMLGARCVACGASERLILHHVIYRQHVRSAGGSVWDVRNAMTVCGRCHRRHHDAVTRLPVALIRAETIEFAIELMGAQRADDYLERYYARG